VLLKDVASVFYVVIFTYYTFLLDPEGGSQNATFVVVVVVVVVVNCHQFSKNPQGFLNTQRSATKLCVHVHAYITFRCTVSDFKINL